MKTDRERLTELFDQAHEKCNSINCVYVCSACKYDGLNYCFEEFLADYLISKGVTIPVRCGECKYCGKYSATGNLYCTHPNGLEFQKKDDFCSYGERKES